MTYRTIVTPMPTVLTRRDHSSARAIQDTQEMGSVVQVIHRLKIFFYKTKHMLSRIFGETDMSQSHFSRKILVVSSDIDECDRGGLSSDHQHLAHTCHDDAKCTNTNGSYYCACLEGYSGSGRNCSGTSRKVVRQDISIYHNLG